MIQCVIMNLFRPILCEMWVDSSTNNSSTLQTFIPISCSHAQLSAKWCITPRWAVEKSISDLYFWRRKKYSYCECHSWETEVCDGMSNMEFQWHTRNARLVILKTTSFSRHSTVWRVILHPKKKTTQSAVTCDIGWCCTPGRFLAGAKWDKKAAL